MHPGAEEAREYGAAGLGEHDEGLAGGGGVVEQRLEGAVAQRHAGGEDGVAVRELGERVGPYGLAPFGGAALEVAGRVRGPALAEPLQQRVDDADDQDAAHSGFGKEVDDGSGAGPGAEQRGAGRDGVGAGSVFGGVRADVRQVGVEGGDPYGPERVVEQVGDGRADAVVERGRGQGAGFHGAGADGCGEAQAEHLVAVAGGAAFVAYGLGGGEGEGHALPGGVGAVGTGADLSEEVVDGTHPGFVRGGGGGAGRGGCGGGHAFTAAVCSAGHSS